MNKEEIENRIIVCEMKANAYREVGNTKTANRYDNERYRWEKLLSDLELLDERKIKELLDYKKGYFDLQQENQELKLELSGYRQAILEDKDMLGLEEENQSLKKQLEEYKYSHSCSFVDTCKNVTIANYNQQKEFIEFLEKMWKETQDIWYIKILQKYKEIIGDKQ